MGCLFFFFPAASYTLDYNLIVDGLFMAFYGCGCFRSGLNSIYPLSMWNFLLFAYLEGMS